MWQKIEQNELIYFTLPKWRQLGADVYISSRFGGVSQGVYDSLNLALHVNDNEKDVAENRRRFFEALSVPAADFVSLQQTHSNNVRFITKEDRGKGLSDYTLAIADTDAMYTKDKDVFMATFYADCLPIALFDPVNKVLALAHAGWRGTYQGIAITALRAMSENCGTKVADVLVSLGPGIGQCCYEVEADFYQRFKSKYEKAERWFKPGEGGKYYFDNLGSNFDFLIDYGLRKENITKFTLCTACNQDLFYSYRGSGGSCGRHGLFGRLVEDHL